MGGTQVQVPHQYIYLWENGEHDPTRWLSLALRGSELCVLHLANLCKAGSVSHLEAVNCPTSYLRECVTRGGALQVTMKNGFLLLHCYKDVLRVEFRASDDISVVKAAFLSSEILQRIEEVSNSESFVFAGTQP